MRFRRAHRRRAEASLELTPLIDVVFLLLIFFLVTATFAQRDRSLLPIDLPEGGTGEGVAAQEDLTLLLLADGSVLIQRRDHADAQRVEPGFLQEVLRSLHDEAPNRPLFLRGDRDVRYGEVIRLLDTVRAVGFRRVYNVIEDQEGSR